jgi:DNA-binding NtrC family response regulator
VTVEGGRHRGASILVVDDEEVVRDVLDRLLRRALAEKFSRDRMIGKSAAMQEVFALIDQVAPSRSTVLIEGESGTGKELVAHAIHARSDRAGGSFVVVPSGNMPADLLESNLFGHTRGAFTGAVAAKKGLFEVADAGTIFFDEISTVQPEVQAKLLRVLQEKEFLPLGATRPVRADARIVAATNVDLLEGVRKGTFREDLYYRLNVIAIRLPPLREREGDVPLLAEHFVRLYSAENGKTIRGLSRAAMERLLDHSWPGNVRELEHAIERAVVLCRSAEIDADLLPEGLGRTTGGAAALPGEADAPLQESLERYERALIERTLARTGGVQKRAAELLGLKPTTLHEKIKRLGIRV